MALALGGANCIERPIMTDHFAARLFGISLGMRDRLEALAPGVSHERTCRAACQQEGEQHRAERFRL